MVFVQQIKVYKGRTNVVSIQLGFDASSDVFSSQIRAGKTRNSDLIAEWDVSFETDGTDGQLVLTLDNSKTEGLTQSTGYMDLKRVSANEPLPVFDEILEVQITDVVTE